MVNKETCDTEALQWFMLDKIINIFTNKLYEHYAKTIKTAE